jgi:hypothetical protein
MTVPYRAVKLGRRGIGIELNHNYFLGRSRLLQSSRVYIALSQKPTQPVLHMYVCIDGKIICRMNIADYIPGDSEAVECWDGTSRAPAYWAVCTAPISFPPETVPRRGFQGFRYTGDLWP